MLLGRGPARRCWRVLALSFSDGESKRWARDSRVCKRLSGSQFRSAPIEGRGPASVRMRDDASEGGRNNRRLGGRARSREGIDRLGGGCPNFCVWGHTLEEEVG